MLVAFVALVGVAGAGNYTPPPGDCCPQWSPHGTQIVFSGNRGTGVAMGVVAATGAAEHFVPGIPVGIRSPDWTHVAYIKYIGADWWLAVSDVDGSGERLLSRTSGGFAWSADSKRLVFVNADRSLRAIAADGTGLVTLAPGPAEAPTWSPDGHILAYVRATDKPTVHVIRNDGRGDAAVEPSARADANPVWSPDGTHLAYWSSDGTTALLKVAQIGGNGGGVAFRIGGAVTNGAIVWAPDGMTIFGAGSGGLVGIDLGRGKRRTLAGIGNAVFSPGGQRIAYTAGGECRDRIGIYVASADGSNRRRITNSCRIVGTPGPDVLHGSFSQVVLGLGGDDTLYADDTYYFFDGNTLYGRPGDDNLVGGYGRDTLYGGPGNDTLTGEESNDILNGGPGNDHLDGDGGGDTIHAADGKRDWITCGKNAYDRRDTVYADQYDVVAKDCEIVHRITQ